MPRDPTTKYSGIGASPSGPVRVGVYLYSVQDLDFSRNTFHPTFEVWFRWRGDAFDPLANLHVVADRVAILGVGVLATGYMLAVPFEKRAIPLNETSISGYAALTGEIVNVNGGSVLCG